MRRWFCIQWSYISPDFAFIDVSIYAKSYIDTSKLQKNVSVVTNINLSRNDISSTYLHEYLWTCTQFLISMEKKMRRKLESIDTDMIIILTRLDSASIIEVVFDFDLNIGHQSNLRWTEMITRKVLRDMSYVLPVLLFSYHSDIFFVLTYLVPSFVFPFCFFLHLSFLQLQYICKYIYIYISLLNRISLNWYRKVTWLYRRSCKYCLTWTRSKDFNP